MQSPPKRALLFIFLTVLLDVTGLGIIIPVVPGLIMELTGEGLSRASIYGGWLLFVYSLMQFLCAPLVGSLSDRFGRRPVLLLSLTGFGLDYVLMGMAPTIGWLFFGRFLAGITGASTVTASAYVADVSPPEKRSQNFGLIGAAFGLGFIIGPVIGGLLGEYGPRIPFFAAAVLTLLNVLYGLVVLPESLPPPDRRPFRWGRANPLGTLREMRKYPILVSLAGALVLMYLSSHATQSTWTFYTMEKFDWSERQVGYSLGFVGVMVALVQGGLTRVVIPRIGSERSVYGGLLLYAVGFAGFALAPAGWFMFLMVVPFSLGGLAGPSFQGIMSNQVGRDAQGELQGAITSLVSLSAIVGPPVMTGLFGYFTAEAAPVYFPGAPFMAGFFLVLGSLAWSWRVFRRFPA